MSGYGTEKVQTNSLNLGFPSAFAKDYANNGPPERYEPQHLHSGMDNTVGDDFQATWHRQKMMDAHRMANAKVRSTHISAVRAFTAHNNRPDHQPAVLGQRKFANPSNGAYESASARLNQVGAPWTTYQGERVSGAGTYPELDVVVPHYDLKGGVVRTSAGQRFVYGRLQDRIAQLNEIGMAKQAFDQQLNVATPFAGAQPTYKDGITSDGQVELAELLQNVLYSVASGRKGMNAPSAMMTDTMKIFQLVVKLSINGDAQDLANVLQFIEGGSAGDGILQLIETNIDTIAESGAVEDGDGLEVVRMNVLQKLKDFFTRLVIYIKETVKYVGRPLADRLSASQGMVKRLQFSKVIKSDFQDMARGFNMLQQPEQFIDTDSRRTQMNINSSRPGFGGAFINPATKREDTQQGSVLPRAYFDQSTQDEYAFGSGEFQTNTGGRPMAFFGEEPLADYGSQPTAQDVQTLQVNRSSFNPPQQMAPQLAISDVAEPGQPALNIRSMRDPATGQYNVVVPQEGAHGTADVAPRGFFTQPSAPKPAPKPASAPAQQKFKRSDVPNTLNELYAFIDNLNQNVPGYSQALYKRGEASHNVSRLRNTTLQKMKASDLLE